MAANNRWRGSNFLLLHLSSEQPEPKAAWQTSYFFLSYWHTMCRLMCRDAHAGKVTEKVYPHACLGIEFLHYPASFQVVRHVMVYCVVSAPDIVAPSIPLVVIVSLYLACPEYLEE